MAALGRMDRSRGPASPAVVFSLVVVIALAGCAKPQETRGPEDDGPGTVDARVGDVTGAPPPPPKDVTLSASQGSFVSPGGLVRIAVEHEGEGPWTLGILDEDRRTVETLSGEGDAARWVSLAAGSYTTNFTGSGRWSGTAQADTRAAAPPVTWTGSGNDGTTGVTLPRGVRTFNVTSEGPMSAWLVDPTGRTVLTIASARNATTDSVSASIKTAGVYVVNVEADGPWTIRVS